jgi:hypothetical protein
LHKLKESSSAKVLKRVVDDKREWMKVLVRSSKCTRRDLRNYDVVLGAQQQTQRVFGWPSVDSCWLQCTSNHLPTRACSQVKRPFCTQELRSLADLPGP